MKILVTGDIGTIGYTLVRELRNREYEVWICDKPHHHDKNYIKCDIRRISTS